MSGSATNTDTINLKQSFSALPPNVNFIRNVQMQAAPFRTSRTSFGCQLPPANGRRVLCQRCPRCIQMRNINEYSSERAPLLAASGVTILNTTRCIDKLIIYLFFFLLVFGTCVGTYLLIIESEGSIIDKFDYISRKDWGGDGAFLNNAPPLNAPVSKILLLKLTSNCTDNIRNCLNYEELFDGNKEQIQKISHGDLLCNFYQDQRGKIYEGRGWNFQSDCDRKEGCDDVVAVGLIEKPNIPPSSIQVHKLKAFLDHSIMNSFLKQCYEILIQRASDRDFEDFAFTLDKMNTKDKTCKYFT